MFLNRRTSVKQIDKGFGKKEAKPEGMSGSERVIHTDEKGTVHVSLSSTKVRIETSDTVITSKLIDGTFPDYALSRPSPAAKYRQSERHGVPCGDA